MDTRIKLRKDNTHHFVSEEPEKGNHELERVTERGCQEPIRSIRILYTWNMCKRIPREVAADLQIYEIKHQALHSNL